MHRLAELIIAAADAPQLREQVATLEEALARRDATIAELLQRVADAERTAKFYYDMHADRRAMAENEWGR